MRAAPAVIGLGVLALGAIVLASRSGGASGAGKGGTAAPESVTPAQTILDRIVAAVSSRDPRRMRSEADWLDQHGYKVQADSLRKTADYWAAASPANVLSGDELDSEPRRAPMTPQPHSPLPELIPAAVVPPDIDPKRLQAQALLLEMEGKPRGEEDRALVAAYQANNALRASGWYTPETALTLATRYGLPPPAPYWPSKGRRRARERYRGALLAIAKRDPQRAEEFEAAAREADR